MCIRDRVKRDVAMTGEITLRGRVLPIGGLKEKIYAGYLEWMYGGVGGEILYMHDNQRWALGIDTYWVKQREFDQKFSFRDYEAITALTSFYYDLPISNMRLKLSAGQFLAKDRGMHIDLSRRFDRGARIGAIVALTDCDSRCVGEGNFNKWIYFQLPMDLFYRKDSTRAVSPFEWAPLTKDAGQKLGKGGGLYNLVIDSSDEVDSYRRKPWSLKKVLSGFGISPH